MADELVIRLVEEVLDSGRTTAEVCAEHPELLPAVEQRLRAYRRLEGRLDDLLPDANVPMGTTATEEAPLPSIPGYEFLKTLGTGGMGVVYLARHGTLGRQVAVKMLLAGSLAGLVEKERLLREARAMATLRHPNIVCVYDVGEADGRPFFTMEYVEGGSLSAHLPGKARSPAAAAEIVLTLARAIAVAHAQGIVHRDLKPANILIAADGTLKICDFGIARSTQSDAAITHPGARLGTPSYMAPEQAGGSNGIVGCAADVYALGAMLYETLTGRPPFLGASAAETEWQVLHDEPVAPSRLDRGIPRDLETIALVCLDKVPDRRYATAAALAEDLARFQRGEPITASRASAPERILKWVRRRPAQAVALAIAFLLFVVLAGGVTWFTIDRSVALRGAEDELQAVARHESASEWSEARRALERARLKLGGRNAVELHARIEAVQGDLDLVAEFSRIQLARSAASRFETARLVTDRDYRSAFVRFGLFPADGSPQTIDVVATAARIANSPVSQAIESALDDWVRYATSRGDVERILEIARTADPDPRWRDLVRTPSRWKEPGLLERLERDVDVVTEPVATMSLFAWILQKYGRDEVPLRQRMQQAHPDDFWANYQLAASLDSRGDADAIGYYRACVALCPQAIAAHNNLASALYHQGRIVDATRSWEDVLRLDPALPLAHVNLATIAYNANRFDAAIEHAEKALAVEPDFEQALGVLGESQLAQYRLAEAEATLRRAVALTEPKPGKKADPLHERLTRVYARVQGLQALERRLPALVAGQETPADRNETLQMAQLLFSRSRFAAAFRFFEMAFALEPKLADKVDVDSCFTAARAALLAGSDRDEGTEKPDEEERGRLRDRAIELLRHELAAADAGLEREPGRTAAWYRDALARWRQSPDLHPIRDPAAIARLPSPQREQCETLWRDLEAIEARAASQR